MCIPAGTVCLVIGRMQCPPVHACIWMRVEELREHYIIEVDVNGGLQS